MEHTEHTEYTEMKHLFLKWLYGSVGRSPRDRRSPPSLWAILLSPILFALLAVTPLVVSANEDDASVAQSTTSESDDARRERYRRRHEMLMERAMKKGQVVPVVPVAPVAPVAPVVAVAPVSLYGNGAANSALGGETVSIKVQSLTFDENNGRGVLTIEVTSGSFSAVNRYIRANIGKLARNDAPGEAAPKIPPDARLKIKSITIDEDDLCKVEFKAKAER